MPTDKKMPDKCRRPDRTEAALEKIEEAIKALELCHGELTADKYKQLRARLGHLMDTLYGVGEALSKST